MPKYTPEDNRSMQLNPNNDRYYSSRGEDRYDEGDEASYAYQGSAYTDHRPFSSSRPAGALSIEAYMLQEKQKIRTAALQKARLDPRWKDVSAYDGSLQRLQKELKVSHGWYVNNVRYMFDT